MLLAMTMTETVTEAVSVSVPSRSRIHPLDDGMRCTHYKRQTNQPSFPLLTTHYAHLALVEETLCTSI
jgi:hypothetical protein